MARSQPAQRQRTFKDPLVLGTFDLTSLRLLTGTLGPLNQVVGRADTNQYSNGGHGGGTMNHWFQINLSKPAWIITRKGEPRPNYIQVSAYDLNRNPIEGRMIFQADSYSSVGQDGNTFYPYIGHVMGAGSDLYNFFDPFRLDRGNDLYFSFEPGSYLLCVSSTRNERLDYSVAVVVEIVSEDLFLLTEDTSGGFLLFEPEQDNQILMDTGPGFNVNLYHDHSRTEWTDAWRRERSPQDVLPEIFIPLTNRA
jgi:hypothetical protein